VILPPRPLPVSPSLAREVMTGQLILLAFLGPLGALGPWLASTGDATVYGWLGALFFWGLALFFVAASVRRIQIARACAADSDEIELDVTILHHDAGRGLEYDYRLPNGRVRRAWGRPLLVQREGAHKLIALRSRRGHILPLGIDLEPLALSDEQRALVRQKLQ
jgi:hypothetical protein